jgi:hypothetical protein
MLSATQYIHDHSLDVNLITQHCQLFGVLPVIFGSATSPLLPAGQFGFATQAEWKTVREAGRTWIELAPWLGVMDHGEFIDIVAWRADDPTSIATERGQAIGLGFEQITNPASWFMGERLMVHRSPLRWLKAGCRGYVPLCHRHGFLALRMALGDIEAEDEEHAKVLDELINPGEWRHEIIVPT